MAEIFAYRADVFVRSRGVDFTGFDVEAHRRANRKGRRGDNANGSELSRRRHRFLDYGKKRDDSGQRHRAARPEDRKMFVSVTKDQIKSAPEHDNEHQCADERCHHDEDRRVLPGASAQSPDCRPANWVAAGVMTGASLRSLDRRDRTHGIVRSVRSLRLRLASRPCAVRVCASNGRGGSLRLLV